MSSPATRTLCRKTARLLSRSLSTFPSGGFERDLLKALVGLALVLSALSASALDPNRLLSQYTRDSWGTENGLPGAAVTSIAQTTDGYLWIGTDKGLARFDGLNFRRFEQAGPDSYEIGPVRALLADGQGNLWILLQNTKLFRYRDGIFDLVRGEAENGVTAIALGPAGGVVLS